MTMREPRIVWESKDGRCRVIKSWDRDDGGEFSLLIIEVARSTAPLDEPVYEMTDCLPLDYVEEMLVHMGLVGIP
jgi:hypothetical protein